MNDSYVKHLIRAVLVIFSMIIASGPAAAIDLRSWDIAVDPEGEPCEPGEPGEDKLSKGEPGEGEACEDEHGERFIVVLPEGPSGVGVLDRETQLVWERSPADKNGDDVITAADRHTWKGARTYCINKTVADRKGWRLPSVHELSTLLDATQKHLGAGATGWFPGGHPFNNVQTSLVEGGGDYWTASTSADSASKAWDVDFHWIQVLDNNLKTSSKLVWCVRGTSPGPSAY